MDEDDREILERIRSLYRAGNLTDWILISLMNNVRDFDAVNAALIREGIEATETNGAPTYMFPPLEETSAEEAREILGDIEAGMPAPAFYVEALRKLVT